MIKFIVALVILSTINCDQLRTRQLTDEIKEMLSTSPVFLKVFNKGKADLAAIFTKKGLYDKPINEVTLSKFDLKGQLPTINALAELRINGEYTVQVLATFDIVKETMTVQNAWNGPFKKFSEYS